MSVPPTTESASARKRWNAFVCQDCRGIFRVPADYQGKGVVCPVCDRMLRLPRAGELLPDLVESDEPAVEPTAKEESIASTQIAEEIREDVVTLEDTSSQAQTDSPKTRGEWRRRKKDRSKAKDIEGEWQKGTDKKIIRYSNGRETLWWAVAGIGFMGLAAAAIIVMRPDKPVAPQIQSKAPIEFIDETVAERAREKAALELLAKERAARAVVEKAFQAKTVEDLIPLLRPVEGLEQKVRAHYGKYPLKPGQLEHIDEITPIFGYESHGFCAKVKLQNFRNGELAILKVGDGYGIDWESWVGWSEMDYEILIAQKPTTAVEVRVTVTPANYYNFDFPSDTEREWQCYRLRFANQNNDLYGYIPRNARDNGIIMPTVEERAKAIILRIRYKDEKSYPTQVIIDSVVAEGWIKDLPQP
jgi:hypothetical protein